MTDFTKAEISEIRRLTEESIREFFEDNRLYEDLIADMLEHFPELYGSGKDKKLKGVEMEKTLAAMIGTAKVRKAVEKYISESRLILCAEMGEDFPEELTEEVYQGLVKTSLFTNRDILKTLISSVAVTALCDKFYYPRLIHELMREVSEAYEEGKKQDN
ncbi:MAG: hypothetical protein IKR59_00825 [Lachnospiraceae bacterium]|nr:hypothetical protein [Lachnospiraceae bacterium]